MTRRELLKSMGYIGCLLMTGSLSYASVFEIKGISEGARYLDLYSLNTGESLRSAYWIDGEYIESSLREINWLLRDYRSGEVAQIDVGLLDLLYLITKLSERERVEVISGYRSPSTNAYLSRVRKGVARDSYHTRGKAIDIRLQGMNLSRLRDLAISLRAGGVGYYPRSGFVHLDTGPFRYW
ncbi:YcbK family protein [Hydrogenobacter sp. T-2]|uniref:YcbK family protein n=1 Tax=Pampinifervens diazotrophicum TaxID=1632018 RepID=UPI002B261832|nr:YcbK family protein [Hydrogenobacter sp. T-2]WPM31931.1 YcbK family protein [Hydrogenobacter sp. T-2]